MTQDNAPHPWNAFTLNELGYDGVDLTDEECANICQQFYKTNNGCKQTRLGAQCPEIDTIIQCKYRRCLQSITAPAPPAPPPPPVDGGRNPFVAIHLYTNRTRCGLDNLTLEEASVLALRYYHIVAQISMDKKFLGNKTFFSRSGSTTIKSMKTNMAAFIIFTFIVGVQRTLTQHDDLTTFRSSDPPMFWCFIVPLAHTMVMMMDNEEKANLTMEGILHSKVGSFVNRLKEKIISYGVWS